MWQHDWENFVSLMSKKTHTSANRIRIFWCQIIVKNISLKLFSCNKIQQSKLASKTGRVANWKSLKNMSLAAEAKKNETRSTIYWVMIGLEDKLGISVRGRIKNERTGLSKNRRKELLLKSLSEERKYIFKP